jgi:hypothetical protein
MLNLLNLKGLTAAPSQVCGAIRIVPLLRETPCEDVRLGLQKYSKDNYATVALNDGNLYSYFVPHGLILHWSNDGTPVAAYGGQVGKKETKFAATPVPYFHRMVKREDRNALRFLPLHIAMEGFLSIAFGGPSIFWEEYVRAFRKYGLGIRSEPVAQGRDILGLEEALRVFEIHERQVGVLLFVAETLAAAFVVPSHADYRLLHDTLLQDFYGETIELYALWHKSTLNLDMQLRTDHCQSIPEIREEMSKLRHRWHHFTETGMASEIWNREIIENIIYRPGYLKFSRFTTDLDPHFTNHIGERLTRENGELLYLKTFTLSAAATRRAYLLKTLSMHDWHLEETAAAFGQTKEALIVRMEKAGFGYLLKPDVLAKARKVS